MVIHSSTDAHPGAGLHCPLCGYDLRGLVDPRCPECGFAFTWAELAAADRDRHAWLFEHGRGRNLRTFAATYVRSAFPRRFWRRVTPANPVRLGRLLLYWAVTNVALLAVIFSSVPGIAIRWARYDSDGRASNAANAARVRSAGRPPGFYLTVFQPSYLDQAYPRPWTTGFARQVWGEIDRAGVGPAAAAAAVGLAWPWLSLASLMIFRWSMRRAKVGTGHVLRVVIYGCDSALLLLVVLGGYYGLREWPAVDEWLSGQVRPALLTTASWPAILAVVTCGAAATYRLAVAYARYLRFDRPVLTVVASQAIVLAAVGVALARLAMSGHF